MSDQTRVELPPRVQQLALDYAEDRLNEDRILEAAESLSDEELVAAIRLAPTGEFKFVPMDDIDGNALLTFLAGVAIIEYGARLEEEMKNK